MRLHWIKREIIARIYDISMDLRRDTGNKLLRCTVSRFVCIFYPCFCQVWFYKFSMRARCTSDEMKFCFISGEILSETETISRVPDSLYGQGGMEGVHRSKIMNYLSWSNACKLRIWLGVEPQQAQIKAGISSSGGSQPTNVDSVSGVHTVVNEGSFSASARLG